MTADLASTSARAGGSSTVPADGRPVRRRALIVTAAVSVLVFLLLSVVVAAGLTQPLDDVTRELFRPGDVWGSTQQTFGYLVDGLAPPISTALLAIGSVVAAGRSRSVRPLLFVGAVGALAVGSTLAAKMVLGRSDGHGDLHGVASSYPSGHLVMLLIALGGLLLLFAPRARWLWLVAGLIVALMGVAILVVAMHWLTDLAASALLGVPVLAVAGHYRDRVLGVGGEARS
jgi:membrane-associated phospholipid phosphatase